MPTYLDFTNNLGKAIRFQKISQISVTGGKEIQLQNYVIENEKNVSVDSNLHPTTFEKVVSFMKEIAKASHYEASNSLKLNDITTYNHFWNLLEDIKQTFQTERQGVTTFQNVQTIELKEPKVVKTEEAAETTEAPKVTKAQQKELIDNAEKLVNFLSEFNFKPEGRTLNTFILKCDSYENAKNFLYSYFNLTDNPFTEDLKFKMESPEFKEIVTTFSNLPKPSKKINSRLTIYYGEAGTGKTYKAMQDNPNASILLGNKSTEPEDLFKRFELKNGKAEFAESDLVEAMQNGTTIIIDEINLYRFDVLQTLQTITDGKEFFTFNGKLIHIKNGFHIIGTMNLKVDDITMPLPQPLVDRAENLQEFKVTTETLLSRFYNFI